MLIVLRLLGYLPLGVLYAIGRGLYWLAFRVVRFRVDTVESNLAKAFPSLPPEERAALADRYLRNLTEVAMEVLKGFSISAAALRDRVRIEGLEGPRADLEAGRPVMLVTAHHCNWEWLLLGLSLELGYPVDAIYKPMKSAWAERALFWMRTRFGGRLTPAKLIVPRVIERRDELRAVAMVADQVPASAPTKMWTKFLGLDTAFYLGAEEIARAVRYPVYDVEMVRTARGRYRATVVRLGAPDDGLDAPRELTRRYAARLEAHVRAHPADWFWSHDRWKLKKPLYAR
jgi:KDO2-lipid IV(A) lauroyltransferase